MAPALLAMAPLMSARGAARVLKPERSPTSPAQPTASETSSMLPFADSTSAVARAPAFALRLFRLPRLPRSRAVSTLAAALGTSGAASVPARQVHRNWPAKAQQADLLRAGG